MDLEWGEARERERHVSEVSYTVYLGLTPGSHFLGFARIRFRIEKRTESTFIDYSGPSIRTIRINNQSVAPRRVFLGKRILISEDLQRLGENVVEITFKNQYACNGLGLHHFQDPEDQEEYVYSQCESFFCHKIFPCFDQPDLKATLRLVTLTPPHWQVIANESEQFSGLLKTKRSSKIVVEHDLPLEIGKEFGGEPVLRVFKETARISPYLYAIIGGPFGYFENKTEGFPAMRIFVRKSLKGFVGKSAEEFFRITRIGIEYYEKFFGAKYPFGKYDQIYCPEYNMGGGMGSYN